MKFWGFMVDTLKMVIFVTKTFCFWFLNCHWTRSSEFITNPGVQLYRAQKSQLQTGSATAIESGSHEFVFRLSSLSDETLKF